MLKGILDVIFGALILGMGAYGLWSGINHGVFRGSFAVRASRDKQPITYWTMVVTNAMLAIAGLLYLLLVLWRMLHQKEVP